MRNFLLILALIFVLVGCEEAKQETGNNVNNETNVTPNTSVNSTTNIKEEVAKYKIKKEDIDEQDFIIDPEEDEEGAMECHIFFMNDKAYYSDGFGNSIRGDYTISGDSISIRFEDFISEYSEKPQKLNVSVVLKMSDENAMLVTETPNTYTIKTSTYSDGKWVFDGGEKEMMLLGFEAGNYFYKVPEVNKIDDSRDWVYDAEYEKNLKSESYLVGDKTYYGKDIVVPFINIDSDYAREVNEDIKNKLEKVVEHYNEGVEDNISYVDSCSYTTFGEENGLFVLFTYGLGATDVVHPIYSAYNFNLVDGSQMNLNYYCNYIGRDKDEVELSIKTKIEEIINEKMNGFTEAEIEKYIDLTKNDFETAFRKDEAVFTITEEGNPAFVVDIQIPAGSEHFDTLIEI